MARHVLGQRRSEPVGTWKIRIGLGEDRESSLPAEGEGARNGWLELGEIEVR